MITEILLVLMSLSVNGTGTSECDYDDDGSDRPYQQDLVDCNDNYYCKNYYGDNESTAQDLLLRTGCDSDSDCPIIDGLGRGQDLVYRPYCDDLSLDR